MYNFTKDAATDQKFCNHYQYLYSQREAPLYCIQGKFSPFSPFWHEGEFKTGLILLFIDIYVRKLESGRIQDLVNQSQSSIGRK